MIREWCEGCGERCILRRAALSGQLIEACPNRCGCEDGPTISDVTEAFWQAIAHERNRLASALRLSRELVTLIGDGVGDQGVDEFALLLDDALIKAEKGEG